MIQRQIGRLLQKNQRAAARYEVSLVDAKSPAGFHLNVKVSEAFDEWARIPEGTYALKTNVTDWDDEKLWRAYIQLAQLLMRQLDRDLHPFGLSMHDYEILVELSEAPDSRLRMTELADFLGVIVR